MQKTPNTGRRQHLLLSLTLGAAMLLTPVVATAQDTSNQDLADKVDVLAAEVARLREQMAIPETEEERMEGEYGMSPVASKVYAANPGLSMGGYGEFYFASQLQEVDGSPARSTGDFYRFVAYLGYKFNDHIIMNTELEFEHATTSDNYEGDAGSVSVEFAYLDFLITRAFNVRAGNLLLPMGFLNTLHEPIFYRGNIRPQLELRIIPTTWRELGVGAHGSLGQGLRYTAYVVNGLNGAEFTSKGIRDGRQKGNQVAFEDVGVVAALDWENEGGLWVGASGFYGGADQGGMTNAALSALKVDNWIAELHTQYRHRGLELRAIFAVSGIEGADQLSELVYPDPSTQLVPSGQTGWYLEAGYDIAPALFGQDARFTLTPWVRYEDLMLQESVPTIAGRSANASLDQRIMIIGLESKPHEQVVLKLDYVMTTSDATSDPSDEIRLGAGFAF